jgi:hypothetical protein
VRLPALPVGGGSDLGLEGEQLELAFKNIEELLSVAVQMSAHVKPRPDVDDFEHRPGLR